MSDEIKSLVVKPSDLEPILNKTISMVRDDMQENPYIQEALKVLPVGGYRSAIGCFWNAVVDDLRNKIMFRSLKLFNKSMTLGRDIKSYEDFQNFVNDDQLIEGAYKIGVIGWEANKVLKHAKETRHIFDGHPKSSQPSVIKVLSMFEDCIKYVLNAEYPSQIIDIDDYITNLGEQHFDRNTVSIQNALGDLPEIYKTELGNKLYNAYIFPHSSTTLRSNIEFVLPILWRVLPKKDKVQLVRRVDVEIPKGNSQSTELAFTFVNLVKASIYLSAVAREYKTKPLIDRWEEGLGQFSVENEVVAALEGFTPFIPGDLSPRFVRCLVLTYVGHIGSSGRWDRTNFFANGAAEIIPNMVEEFDQKAIEEFIEVIKNEPLLKRRIVSPVKMRRLRTLGTLLANKIPDESQHKGFLDNLVDEQKEGEFLAQIGVRRD